MEGKGREDKRKEKDLILVVKIVIDLQVWWGRGRKMIHRG